MAKSGRYKQRSVLGRELTEHVLVVEQVMGKPLPRGAHVHHVDNNGRNNAHANLVVCQDIRYHKLLHARQRIHDAGGNPNTQRLCSLCKQIKPIEEFSVNRRSALGTQTACRSCAKVYWARRAAS